MNDKPALPIAIPEKSLSSFCQRWSVQKVALFGSVLREDFTPQSDIDILLQFAPDARHTLSDEDRMREELSYIFGRPVDVVDWQAIAESPNYIRRRHILDHSQVIHAR